MNYHANKMNLHDMMYLQNDKMDLQNDKMDLKIIRQIDECVLAHFSWQKCVTKFISLQSYVLSHYTNVLR